MIEPEKVAVVLLAAGLSTRFGAADKLMTDVAGRPMVAHAAATLSQMPFGRSIAVCRDPADSLGQLLSGLGFEIVVNPAPERGLASSLGLGVAEAATGPSDAALICLADMPFVTSAHLSALLARFDPEHPVVASTLGEIRMPPALFARSLFQDLAARTGDAGARTLLADAALVPAPAAMLTDIDRPEDLAR